MLNLSRYPRFNDSPHIRPTISTYGNTAIGELAWILIPLVALALAVFLR